MLAAAFGFPWWWTAQLIISTQFVLKKLAHWAWWKEAADLILYIISLKWIFSLSAWLFLFRASPFLSFFFFQKRKFFYGKETKKEVSYYLLACLQIWNLISTVWTGCSNSTCQSVMHMAWIFSLSAWLFLFRTSPFIFYLQQGSYLTSTCVEYASGAMWCVCWSSRWNCFLLLPSIMPSVPVSSAQTR